MTPHDETALPDTQTAPELPAGAALVALVPAIGDLDRAAEAAWDFARRVANTGRRVALIDCYVDAPRLHAVAGEPDGDGIVDVFEYGASLSRIARAQPEGTLFFVPAGTFSPDPAGMMARPRWRRLSAGFRHEDAVMLLFLPPNCLGALASEVDGLVVIGPGEAGSDFSGSPEIGAALARGIPLLATFAVAADVAPGAPPTRSAPPGIEQPPSINAQPGMEEREPPGAEAGSLTQAALPLDGGEPSGPPGRPVLRRRPGTGSSRRRLGVYLLILALAAAAAAITYRRELGWSNVMFQAGPSQPEVQVVPAFRQLVPHAVDTLPFAVQVSAWTRFAQALEDADTIEGRGFLPMIATVRLQRTTWYRVYVGPVDSQDAADSLLGTVRAAGLDGSNAATVSLVPFSLALRRTGTLLAARAERSRLRAAGVAAFVLGQADGSYQLFAGAFDSPDQAAYLDSLLTSTGSAGQLGPRVGFRP